MKVLIVVLSLVSMLSFTDITTTTKESQPTIEATTASSFSLINDTKRKVSIHTGSGFVSLNKGSRTSITCNVGKEVRWASKGSKGDVIFTIGSEHCGKTIKLSNVM